MTEHKRRLKELMSISAPIMLEQVFIMLMGVINIMMVSAVGEHAVSAAGMIDSISNIIIALFTALTTGGTIVVAQNIGKKDLKQATQASAQTLSMAVIFSLCIFVIFYFFRRVIVASLFGSAEINVIDAGNTYFLIIIFSYPFLAVTQTIYGILRGSGNTGTPMVITIGMNILNVLLGFCFIFGININFFDLFTLTTPAYGVAGAAMALVLARFVGMVAAIVYITRFSNLIRLNSLQAFKPNIDIQKIVLGFGVPTGIESSLFQVGRLITQIYIVSMGTSAMAANSIASSLFGFINVPGTALSMGVMILVGQKVGRGETDDIKKATVFAVFVGTILMTILCLLSFPATDLLISLYRPGPKATVYIRQLLYSSYIATSLIWALSFVTPAALRATGDVKYTMTIAIISMWTFRIIIGYFFGIVLEWGVLGVWLGMYTDWAARGTLFYLRLAKGKWKNKLTGASE